jgi:hypothetical protein
VVRLCKLEPLPTLALHVAMGPERRDGETRRRAGHHDESGDIARLGLPTSRRNRPALWISHAPAPPAASLLRHDDGVVGLVIGEDRYGEAPSNLRLARLHEAAVDGLVGKVDGELCSAARSQRGAVDPRTLGPSGLVRLALEGGPHEFARAGYHTTHDFCRNPRRRCRGGLSRRLRRHGPLVRAVDDCRHGRRLPLDDRDVDRFPRSPGSPEHGEYVSGSPFGPAVVLAGLGGVLSAMVPAWFAVRRTIVAGLRLVAKARLENHRDTIAGADFVAEPSAVEMKARVAWWLALEVSAPQWSLSPVGGAAGYEVRNGRRAGNRTRRR